MKSYVYIIENVACSLSCYVGKANDPIIRFKQHLAEINDPRPRFLRSYFTNALRKYGAECFKLHIVDECQSEHEAFNLEREWISYLKEMGVHLYNRSPGGYGGEKRALEEEIRLKMSRSQKRKFESIELRKRISDKLKGHIKSAETCAKLSLVKRKAVEQLDLQGSLIARFESGKEAELVTGTSRSKICECCKGRRNKAGGFRWRYKE